MKITIQSTDTVTEIDGRRVRLWEGVTPAGSRVWVFVSAVSVSADDASAPEDADELRRLGGLGPRPR